MIKEVEQLTPDLAGFSAEVEFRADGEPLLKGTKVEVHRIAALLDGGASIGQVLEDYPSLSRENVETAKTYARAYPRATRPYPRTSIKRALQGAQLEALDDA